MMARTPRNLPLSRIIFSLSGSRSALPAGAVYDRAQL
jgi:hypothetical protein